MKVVVLERAVVALVKTYQDRHDFAQTERALTLASFHTTAEQLAMPARLKALAEVIDGAEQVF